MGILIGDGGPNKGEPAVKYGLPNTGTRPMPISARIKSTETEKKTAAAAARGRTKGRPLTRDKRAIEGGSDTDRDTQRISIGQGGGGEGRPEEEDSVPGQDDSQPTRVCLHSIKELNDSPGCE